MIRAMIIEDEKKSRDMLSTLLNRYCTEIIIEGQAENITEAINIINQLDPELVFLDISMPDGNGFDVLEQFPPNDFEVIFITAYNEYAIKAIKAKAIDYLLKPLNITELQHAVQKAAQRIYEKKALQHRLSIPGESKNNAPQQIAIPVNDGLQFITIDNIIRLTASGSYTQIYCSDNTNILSSRALKDYEDILPPNLFFRVHHSHLINLTYIKHYYRGDGGYVTMTDGSNVDISKRRKKEFLDLFLK